VERVAIEVLVAHDRLVVEPVERLLHAVEIPLELPFRGLPGSIE